MVLKTIFNELNIAVAQKFENYFIFLFNYVFPEFVILESKTLKNPTLQDH
jgi:hypothetical protein